MKQRKQFGRVIGSYQALKHQAADVRIGLDFARPLVHGAALTFDSVDRARDVSAAKVAVSDAAYGAAGRLCSCTARSGTPRSTTSASGC